jgi:hypothetical protein
MKSRDILKKKKDFNTWRIKINPDLMQQHTHVSYPELVYRTSTGVYDQNMNKIPEDRYY